MGKIGTGWYVVSPDCGSNPVPQGSTCYFRATNLMSNLPNVSVRLEYYISGPSVPETKIKTYDMLLTTGWGQDSSAASYQFPTQGAYTAKIKVSLLGSTGIDLSESPQTKSMSFSVGASLGGVTYLPGVSCNEPSATKYCCPGDGAAYTCYYAKKLWQKTAAFSCSNPSYTGPTCTPVATRECTPGTTKCVGVDLYRCRDDGAAWNIYSPNTSQCGGGQQCTDGATKCVGTTQQICRYGSWRDDEYNSPKCGYVTPVITPIPTEPAAPTPTVPAYPSGSCVFEGKTYANGETFCKGLDKYTCKNGALYFGRNSVDCGYQQTPAQPAPTTPIIEDPGVPSTVYQDPGSITPISTTPQYPSSAGSAFTINPMYALLGVLGLGAVAVGAFVVSKKK